MALDRIMNYGYYRLYDTTTIRSAQNSRRLQEEIKTFRATLESVELSAEERVMVSVFLTRMIKETSILGASGAMLSSSSRCY